MCGGAKGRRGGGGIHMVTTCLVGYLEAKERKASVLSFYLFVLLSDFLLWIGWPDWIKPRMKEGRKEGRNGIFVRQPGRVANWPAI